MNHITEIIPEFKDMPEWAKDAFEDGQFFAATIDKLNAIKKECQAYQCDCGACLTSHCIACRIMAVLEMDL